MNAIVQALHDRALASAPQHDPHLMHGILLLLEEGISPNTIGLAIGQSSTSVRGLAQRARDGELRRAAAWMGERYSTSESDAAMRRALTTGPGEKKARELFTVPWYRDVILKMALPDGATSSDVHAIAARHNRLGDESEIMRRLKSALDREGFTVLVDVGGSGAKSRYRLSGDDAIRIQNLAAARWFEVVP